MQWTLANIEARIRSLTGKPAVNELPAIDLLNFINNYYQNVFPIEFEVKEFEGFTEYETVAGTGMVSVPATVLSVCSPITAKDSDDVIYPMDFYTDKGRFFDLFPDDAHDEATERQRPSALLLYGRMIYLRPVPDAIYTIKYFSKAQLPTALANPTDAPADRLWGPVIIYGTSIEILQEGGEDEEADSLKDLYDYYKGLIKVKQIKQIPLGSRALPRF